MTTARDDRERLAELEEHLDWVLMALGYLMGQLRRSAEQGGLCGDDLAELCHLQACLLDRRNQRGAQRELRSVFKGLILRLVHEWDGVSLADLFWTIATKIGNEGTDGLTRALRRIDR